MLCIRDTSPLARKRFEAFLAWNGYVEEDRRQRCWTMAPLPVGQYVVDDHC